MLKNQFYVLGCKCFCDLCVTQMVRLRVKGIIVPLYEIHILSCHEILRKISFHVFEYNFIMFRQVTKKV